MIFLFCQDFLPWSLQDGLLQVKYNGMLKNRDVPLEKMPVSSSEESRLFNKFVSGLQLGKVYSPGHLMLSYSYCQMK